MLASILAGGLSLLLTAAGNVGADDSATPGNASAAAHAQTTAVPGNASPSPVVSEQVTEAE
jgi:hypothetical protein